MTAQAHADAVMVRLRAREHLTVYPPETGGPKTVPAGTRPPYVAVDVKPWRKAGPALTGQSSRLLLRIYCHCVGLTADSALGVADEVAAALLDWLPEIPGRACFPIRQEPGPDTPRVDESTDELVVTLTEVYRLESVTGVA